MAQKDHGAPGAQKRNLAPMLLHQRYRHGLSAATVTARRISVPAAEVLLAVVAILLLLALS